MTYTPTIEEVRKAWVSYRLDYERFGNDNAGQGEGVLEEDFDGCLRSMKADAWDEGFDTGYDRVLVEKSVEPGAKDLRVNPYRETVAGYGDSFFGPNPAASLTIRKEQQ